MIRLGEKDATKKKHKNSKYPNIIIIPAPSSRGAN